MEHIQRLFSVVRDIESIYQDIESRKKSVLSNIDITGEIFMNRILCEKLLKSYDTQKKMKMDEKELVSIVIDRMDELVSKIGFDMEEMDRFIRSLVYYRLDELEEDNHLQRCWEGEVYDATGVESFLHIRDELMTVCSTMNIYFLSGLSDA
jgi:uncharacterized protein with ATP-grasp and redox domains